MYHLLSTVQPPRKTPSTLLAAFGLFKLQPPSPEISPARFPRLCASWLAAHPASQLYFLSIPARFLTHHSPAPPVKHHSYT